MASKTLKVKVIKLCYVGHKRREVGSVFQVQTSIFSPTCMEILIGELSAEQVKKFKAKGFEDKALKPSVPEPEAVEEVAGIDPPEPKQTASDAEVI